MASWGHHSEEEPQTDDQFFSARDSKAGDCPKILSLFGKLLLLAINEVQPDVQPWKQYVINCTCDIHVSYNDLNGHVGSSASITDEENFDHQYDSVSCST